MVTAASSADAAVVLVDATKLDWQNPALELLPQTRRHSLLCNLLRVPSHRVRRQQARRRGRRGRWPLPTSARALETFARAAGIAVTAIVPISALKG